MVPDTSYAATAVPFWTPLDLAHLVTIASMSHALGFIAGHCARDFSNMGGKAVEVPMTTNMGNVNLSMWKNMRRGKASSSD